MTADIEGGAAAAASRPRLGAPDRTDRILIIAAIALWLAALGAGVAAVVALVDLASAHSVGTAKSDTPWLLYTVIGVSALVIIGAIPLLLKARQSASVSPVRGDSSDVGARPSETSSVAQRLQPFGAPVLRRYSTPPAGHRVGFPTAAVVQIWLRCTATVAAAMGAAATAIGVATYLMASGHDTAAWIVYAVAGLITAGMTVVPWTYLRQLHAVLGSAS